MRIPSPILNFHKEATIKEGIQNSFKMENQLIDSECDH
jgi:hypothetical protein